MCKNRIWHLNLQWLISYKNQPTLLHTACTWNNILIILPWVTFVYFFIILMCIIFTNIKVKCYCICKLTIVEGDQKALFSIATTPRCRGALLLSLDCSTLPLIHTLYCWVLSKNVSSTILKVFGMTRPGIEPRSPGPLANTLPTRPMSWFRSELAYHGYTDADIAPFSSGDSTKYLPTTKLSNRQIKWLLIT